MFVSLLYSAGINFSIFLMISYLVFITGKLNEIERRTSFSGYLSLHLDIYRIGLKEHQNNNLPNPDNNRRLLVVGTCSL